MSCNFRDTKAGEKISLKFLFFRIREFHRARQKDIRLAHNGLKCRLDVPQFLYLHFGIWFPPDDFESSGRLSMCILCSFTSRKVELVLGEQTHRRPIRKNIEYAVGPSSIKANSPGKNFHVLLIDATFESGDGPLKSKVSSLEATACYPIIILIKELLGFIESRSVPMKNSRWSDSRVSDSRIFLKSRGIKNISKLHETFKPSQNIYNVTFNVCEFKRAVK